MNRSVMTYGISLLVATGIAGCAMAATAPNPAARSVKLLAVRDAAEQAFVYRLVTARSTASAVVDRMVTGQCKGGETGYWATVEADTDVLLFLVSTPETSVISGKNFVRWMDAKGSIMAWGPESSL